MTTTEHHSIVERAQRQLYNAARNYDLAANKRAGELHLTAQVTLTLAMWSEHGDVFAAMLDAQLTQLSKYLNKRGKDD